MVNEPIVVSILQQGNLVRVTPALESVLGTVLQYTHLLQAQGFKQPKVKVQQRILYTLDANGSLIAPAGLLQRICKTLKQYGYVYEYKDMRPVKNLTLDLKRLSASRPGQDEALAAIIGNDRGVVVAPTAYGKSWLLRELCSIYPDANIIICTSRVAVLQSHYRRLQSVLPESELGIVSGSHRNPARVTVSTSHSLLKCDVDKCDIFLFDEVHESAAEETSNYIAHVSNARMYGFTASPTGRSDQAELAIEALFGPVIYSMTYQEAVRLGLVSQLYAHFNSVSGDPMGFDSKTQRPTKFRHGIWFNENRNRRIAEVARRYDGNTQVLITVDTVQHAFAIHKELPEFHLCYNDISPKIYKTLKSRGLIPADYTPLTMEQRWKMQEMFEKRELMKVIATPVWHVGVDFTTLEVLIRADGQAGEIGNIQVPGRLSRIADGKQGGILEDFSDEFEPYFQRHAQSRKRSYKQRGWEITSDRKDDTYLLSTVQGV